jgi:hypothetical protein
LRFLDSLKQIIISFAFYPGFFGTKFVDLKSGLSIVYFAMRYFKKLIVTVITFAFFLNAGAQFYNGHQMTFGKNKVQYFNYYWSFYRFDDFDCYFN